MSSAVDLQTVVKRRVRALENHLPAAVQGDSRALHRTRVASRRLREVLPLVASADGKIRKGVRRLTAWLGRVRELDVALALVESAGIPNGASRGALIEARQQLHLIREKRRAKMLRRLEDLDPEKLARRLHGLIVDASGEDADAWRRKLAARLARRANDLRTAVAEAGSLYVPERLHAVRIAAKKLRYALEVAAELGVKNAARRALVVRRSQITLGDLQDRHVLSRHLREAGEEMSAQVRSELDGIAGTLEASCRELHARFLAQRDSLDEALADVLQQVVPALAHPRRARKPLKAATAVGSHGRSNRAVSHSTRDSRGTRQRLA